MKQSILIFSLLLCTASLFASFEEYDTWYFDNELETYQSNSLPVILRSSYGYTFPTAGTFRGLTIFVNIIFDQTNSNIGYTHYWIPDITSSINNLNKLPTYMFDLFDTEVKPNPRGIITRMFAESSFNQLILLSDFMVVNIYQSQITPVAQWLSPGRSFDEWTLMNAVIRYINENGGLQVIHKYNNRAVLRPNSTIQDYDILRTTSRGRPKYLDGDNRIDFINFMIRNGTPAHGGRDLRQGRVASPQVSLRIGNSVHLYNVGTFQNIGIGNITRYGRNVLTHEIAHFFLGGNESHTSGGTALTEGGVSTFISKQWGYGLYNGMPTANAFERWRLGWMHTTNQPHRIAALLSRTAARGVSSDITQTCGAQTFYLRDFVTYGDAIRIKLPHNTNQYASNQYIWLVNHQMTRNNKMDFPMYSGIGTCRDVAVDGIIAFHQVGRDTLEHINRFSVFPTREKDNLRMISADGNFNIVYRGRIRDCLNNGDFPLFEFISPNPLLGVNNQTEALRFDTSLDRIRFREDHLHIGARIRNGVLQDNLPWYGDRSDVFVPRPEVRMDISTNPPPVNVVTYYSARGTSTMTIVDTLRNTRRIYLTGLSIRMIDPNPVYTGMKTYRVEIRWDDYDVKQDVNWAGDIVMKEELNLLSDRTIYLEQNLTVIQTTRDPVSGFFAPPTRFTAKSGSIFTMNPNSRVILSDKSTFVLEGGSNLIIKNDAEIIVEAGSTFKINSGANLTIQGGGRLVIMPGAYLCVEAGANIELRDFNSVISMRYGAIYGVNPLLFTSNTCLSSISFTGEGLVPDYSQDVFIQNETITSNRYVAGRNIFVGRAVTNSIPHGNVVITNNARVVFDAQRVVFDSGFRSNLGSTFRVVRQ